MKHKFDYVVDWDESDEIFIENKNFEIPYFVSNYGRVKKDDGFILKPMMVKGSNGLFVNLRYKTKKKYTTKVISLAALVLDSFQGGYAKNRKVVYRDNNKKNCKLENLKWKYGWNGQIDLLTIDFNDLDKDNKLIYNYLSTGDMMSIQKVIINHEGIIKIICYEKGGIYYFEDAKIDLFLTLKKIFDSGRYKPGNNRIVPLLSVIIKTYIRDIKVKNLEIEVHENTEYYEIDSGENM